MDSTLQKFDHLFAKKMLWLGDAPSFQADAIQLDSVVNFRADAKEHGKYQVLWLYESNLFSNKSWPLLLDEAIYLLQKQGVLVCRVRECWYHYRAQKLFISPSRYQSRAATAI